VKRLKQQREEELKHVAEKYSSVIDKMKV